MRKLAFVDVETTGPSPTEDRVREIGVVLVDDGKVNRWTSLLRIPYSDRRRWKKQLDENPISPRFQDVATDLSRMFAGRLVIAHNARFDYGFLSAEFGRVGIEFRPSLLCSVMLSRRLCPELDRHDLDALVQHHDLAATIRHRALPDADLIWQLWQTLEHSLPPDFFSDAIEKLLAGPVLPEGLDTALVEKLPTAPGAYLFHGEHNQILLTGAAGNLRSQVLKYFRIDHVSTKALEYAHRITNITWRVTRGLLGAQLNAALLDPARRRPKARSPQFCCRFVPDATPSAVVAPLEDCIGDTGESFGLFPSERKAKNALRRLALEKLLCTCLLGVDANCPACGGDERGRGCIGRVNRAKQLARIFVALNAWDRPSWPYAGPIGIRESSDLHIVDCWQYLGTAQDEAGVHSLLEWRHDRETFDEKIYVLLKRTLPRLDVAQVVRLGGVKPLNYE
jgi:DNA polymerase-3 subunit epsilon